jgi:hypothetical protein
MSNLSLSLRVQRFTQDKQIIVLGKANFEFSPTKVMSPAIRSGAEKTLNDLLNSVASKPEIKETDGVEPRILHAEELRRLADMIEKGDKSCEAIILELTDAQHIFLKLKRE